MNPPTEQQVKEARERLKNEISIHYEPESEGEKSLLKDIQILDAALEQAQKYIADHNKPVGFCYICKKPYCSLAANPGQWPVWLCFNDEPGIAKPCHVSCVSDNLRELTLLRQQKQSAEEALKEARQLTDGIITLALQSPDGVTIETDRYESQELQRFWVVSFRNEVGKCFQIEGPTLTAAVQNAIEKEGGR